MPDGNHYHLLAKTLDGRLSVACYIVRNPVAAGLCASPCEWPWSSHRATLGLAPASWCDPALLLAFYAPTRERAQLLYREHAETEASAAPGDHPLIVGDDAYVTAMLERVEPAPGTPARYRQRPRPPLGDLLDRGADVTAIALAHDHGYSLREIARELGVSASTISRRLRALRAAGSATQHEQHRATTRT